MPLLSFHVIQAQLFLLLYFTILSNLVPMPYILSVHINTWFYASYMNKLAFFPLIYENVFPEFTAIKLNPKFNISLVPFPFFSKWVIEILKKIAIQWFHYFTVKPLNTEEFFSQVRQSCYYLSVSWILFSSQHHCIALGGWSFIQKEFLTHDIQS